MCRWKRRCLPPRGRAACARVDGLGMLLHQAVPGFRVVRRRTEVDDELRHFVAADLLTR